MAGAEIEWQRDVRTDVDVGVEPLAAADHHHLNRPVLGLGAHGRRCYLYDAANADR